LLDFLIRLQTQVQAANTIADSQASR